MAAHNYDGDMLTDEGILKTSSLDYHYQIVDDYSKQLPKFIVHQAS